MNRQIVQAFRIKAIDDERREISGWASRSAIDRMGDEVVAEGARFAVGGVPLLLGHDSSQPVGRAVLGRPTRDGIPFTARIPKIAEPGTLQTRADEAWQSVKYGVIDSVSIGFRVLDNAVERIETGLRFLKFEILELSLVAVPASPGAEITGFRSASRKPGAIAASGRTDHVVRLRDAKPATAVVKLTAADVVRGKILLEAEQRRAAREARGERHVVRLTRDAQERAAIIERSRAELVARRYEGLLK